MPQPLKPDLEFTLKREQIALTAPLFINLNQPNPKTRCFDAGMLSGAVLAVLDRNGKLKCLRLDHQEIKSVSRSIRRVLAKRN